MSRTKRPIKTTETVILVILAAGLVFLGVKLFQLRETDRQYRAIEEAVGTEDGLSDLAAENREVIAWLRVDGTAIDYPVTQAGDNIKYVGTDVKGKSSFAGNPFLDHRNDPGFTDVYSIIYGHDMEDHLLFSDLSLFLEKEFWNGERKGSILLTDGQRLNIRFFAAVKAKASDNRFMDPLMVRNNWGKEFWDEMMSCASIATDTIDGGDHIIALSTCSSAGSEERIVLLGKILR